MFGIREKVQLTKPVLKERSLRVRMREKLNLTVDHKLSLDNRKSRQRSSGNIATKDLTATEN